MPATMRIITITKDSQTKLQNDFFEHEFFSSDKFFTGNDHVIDARLPEIAQAVRDYYGCVVIVSSSYRTIFGNSLLSNAAPNSTHLSGLALDLDPVCWDRKCVNQLRYDIENRKGFYLTLYNLGVRGIGIYNGHLHVDTREGDDLAFWDSSSYPFDASDINTDLSAVSDNLPSSPSAFKRIANSMSSGEEAAGGSIFTFLIVLIIYFIYKKR